jgi:hypothetical protein
MIAIGPPTTSNVAAACRAPGRLNPSASAPA